MNSDVSERWREVAGALGRMAAAAMPVLRPRQSARRTAAPPAGPPGYPGDYHGLPQLSYAPTPGRSAEPGEVVWSWVPYEEDHSCGKDRPVLVIGHDKGWLLALPMTSKDHDRDLAQEAAAGRHWVDLGSGNWDARGRPSEVRVDRIVRIDPLTVRRIGGQVSRARFNAVAEGLREHWGD